MFFRLNVDNRDLYFLGIESLVSFFFLGFRRVVGCVGTRYLAVRIERNGVVRRVYDFIFFRFLDF